MFNQVYGTTFNRPMQNNTPSFGTMARCGSAKKYSEKVEIKFLTKLINLVRNRKVGFAGAFRDTLATDYRFKILNPYKGKLYVNKDIIGQILIEYSTSRKSQYQLNPTPIESSRTNIRFLYDQLLSGLDEVSCGMIEPKNKIKFEFPPLFDFCSDHKSGHYLPFKKLVSRSGNA